MTVQAISNALSRAITWAFAGAILAPLALGFLSFVIVVDDSSYWTASVVGTIGGALCGAIRSHFKPRSARWVRAIAELLGLALVLLIGVPCSGIGGALIGILYWGIEQEITADDLS